MKLSWISTSLIYGLFEQEPCSGHEEEEITKLRDEIQDIYERYPNVMHILDLGMAHTLTEEESKALIKVVVNHSYISMLEEVNVYYKGCTDSIGYLCKLKLLKEPEG